LASSHPREEVTTNQAKRSWSTNKSSVGSYRKQGQLG
jgi:hypothetical protein